MSAGIKYHRVNHFFDSSTAHKLPHVQGPQVKEWLDEIKFKIPFEPTFKFSQEYDIPYLCGYDARSDIWYGDRDFSPTSFDGSDKPITTLGTHEEVEKLLERFNLTYQQRHHVATHCENLMCDYFGIDWNRYTAWTTRSWHASYAKWKKPGRLIVPTYLDMSPYVDEDDRLLKAMRKAGAKDEGKEA